MKSALLCLTFCVLTAAMVPRDRESANEPTTTTTNVLKQYCAPQTPCAWAKYRPYTKTIEVNITNTYCECSPDTVCLNNEDDTNVGAYVYRCRVPVSEEVETVES